MERPSGLPQAEGNAQGGQRLLQPQSNGHPNIVPVSNPPGPPGSILQASRVPPRNATITGRKQMSSSNKVAIPRQRSGNAPRYSRRVPLACETCRMRKTKCSGDTPICRQCLELRVDCRYPVSWRERMEGFVSPILPPWVPRIFCAMITDCWLLGIDNSHNFRPSRITMRTFSVRLTNLLTAGCQSRLSILLIKFVLFVLPSVVSLADLRFSSTPNLGTNPRATSYLRTRRLLLMKSPGLIRRVCRLLLGH